MKENQCDTATPMMIKNYLRKTFADITADEIEERIIQAICGPRSKQEVDVSQRLLKILVDVTGEQCTLQTPRNGTQRILVFTADQIAVWMINAVDNADKVVLDRRERRLHGIDDDGGKGDGYDEGEVDDDKPVQIIHRKKRPSSLDSKPAGSGDNAAEKTTKGGKKPATTSSSKKPGQEMSSNEPAGGQGGASKRKTKKRGSDEEGDTSKTRNKTSRDQAQRDDGSKKGARDKEKKDERKSKGASQSQAGARGTSESGRKDSAKRSTSGNKPTTDKEESAAASAGKAGPKASSQSKTNAPTRRASQTSASQAGGKTGGPARVSTAEERRETDSRRGSKSGEQRPRTASELQRERVGEMISSHISSLIREGSTRQTPRAEALKDIISKKLVGSTIPLDQQALDAIKDASVLLAAYIDKQAENVELEYGTAPPPKALAQRGKGPVFSVKPTQSSFAIRQVTHYDAAQKVAESRGRPKPGAITLSKGGFNPKEGKEWARWANDVVNMADKWSRWIDSTVSKAVTSAEKKKAGQDVPGWRDWKETTGEEALEWRRNKKLLSQSAALFQDKVDRTAKPQSAPAPGASQSLKDLPKKK